jgi:hypothetical protein
MYKLLYILYENKRPWMLCAVKCVYELVNMKGCFHSSEIPHTSSVEGINRETAFYWIPGIARQIIINKILRYIHRYQRNKLVVTGN